MHHIPFGGLVLQASVPCLPVSEPALDYREYVLDFCFGRGLLPLTALHLSLRTGGQFFDCEGRRLVLYQIFLPLLFRRMASSRFPASRYPLSPWMVPSSPVTSSAIICNRIMAQRKWEIDRTRGGNLTGNRKPSFNRPSESGHAFWPLRPFTLKEEKQHPSSQQMMGAVLFYKLTCR